MNFWLARDQFAHLWNSGKFVWQPRQENIFYAVIYKRFQTRTEKEIEQIISDKSSKSINKIFNERSFEINIYYL